MVKENRGFQVIVLFESQSFVAMETSRFSTAPRHSFEAVLLGHQESGRVFIYPRC